MKARERRFEKDSRTEEGGDGGRSSSDMMKVVKFLRKVVWVEG